MRKPLRSAPLVFIATLLALLAARPASAFSGGIASTVFGASGCNQCHSGGTAPTVTLDGPAVVAPGSTNEYTFTVLETGLQDHAGLNVSAAAGVLSTGGSLSAGTQVIQGAGGRGEITHTEPKDHDDQDQIRFSFLWTAPETFTSVTLNAWGNAVNDNRTAVGDRASFTSLEVFSSDAGIPTRTATPEATAPTTPGTTPAATTAATPGTTATPESVCASDLSPPNPTLLVDADARKCQDAIGRAGRSYLKCSLKVFQKCLLAVQAGKLDGDAEAVCTGSTDVAPTDPKSAQAIVKLEAKARAAIEKKCGDETIAGLLLCAETVSGFEECFLSAHRTLVETLVGHEFGAVNATADKAEQKCQKTIAGEAGKLVSAELKAMQKCLSKRNKAGMPGDGAALCLGSVVDGEFLEPTDAKTADAIVKAAGKMRAKVVGACSGAQLAALDACASDASDLADCLECTHRAAAFEAVAAEYTGP